ncbi:NAD(P)/FAD-dependent oxidoreductase [Ruminococcus sp.]|uniref:NAD(P)/FAD-dependent oxidoreductase n=1 Tax=Ruminococcus sp. TaxID=41978 RepID=UPI0025CDF121|nr:NAD(P)/FAD-dependent oxidoreductase [Ruminococcus sp.]MBQ9543241.1 NAD(P)/FAD-dependent oxidoreductase [Ruminococcus sp.]
MMYDVIIIGGGVTGCAAAAELAKYQLDVCLVEKESDVCEGTSKANSAIVHAGFDAEPDTLKAKLNVRGNAMIAELSNKLDFAFKNNGAMVLCFEEDRLTDLKKLREKGEKNGVAGLEILSGDEARAREPRLSKEVKYALYAPTSGIVCPFEMTLAFAENAYANGVEFRLSTEVTAIEKNSEGWKVITDKGEILGRYIFNCAGVYADKIAEMANAGDFRIIPRKGEYMLMDKDAGETVSHTIFQLPTKMGKGVLVTPTVHGNLLVGPTAEDIDDKENTSTTAGGLAEIRAKSALSVEGLPFGKVITGFTGLRAVGDTHDFIINEGAEGFFNAAGIESPGLTSAPAIAEMLREMLSKKTDLTPKTDHIDTREGVVHFAELSREEQNALIAKEPTYGNIVCRCETITEGEIRDAINRPLGAVTLDGVKRRTRAGMGRCQAGFCSPKTILLLAEKLGCGIGGVRKTGCEEVQKDA